MRDPAKLIVKSQKNLLQVLTKLIAQYRENVLLFTSRALFVRVINAERKPTAMDWQWEKERNYFFYTLVWSLKRPLKGSEHSLHFMYIHLYPWSCMENCSWFWMTSTFVASFEYALQVLSHWRIRSLSLISNLCLLKTVQLKLKVQITRKNIALDVNSFARSRKTEPVFCYFLFIIFKTLPSPHVLYGAP